MDVALADSQGNAISSTDSIFKFTAGTGTTYSLDIDAPSAVESHTVTFSWTVNDGQNSVHTSTVTYSFGCSETEISDA
jgi:hypothetical protein